jgi:hypothetical protein
MPVSKTQIESLSLFGRLRAQWRAVISWWPTRKAALDREKAEQVAFLMERYNKDTPGQALAFWEKLSREYIRQEMGTSKIVADREREAEELLSRLGGTTT